MPANVHILRGNPSKKSAAELTAGVNPAVEIPGCPKHLLPEAKKEWRRIGPELEALGLISKIDRPALALYCQEWAWLVWHENLLQRDVNQAAAKEAEHDAAESVRSAKAAEAGESYTPTAWTGGDGFMLPTPNGSFTYNPHWVARNKHAAQVDKFLASFGMSPSSRGRVSPSSNQLPLFPVAAEDKGGFKAF
jgi:P27 family predicted phage terminase small subunit